MSEIRLVRIPSTNLLPTNCRFCVLELADAEHIFRGSRDIPRELCDTLANSFAFCRYDGDRYYIISSKIGTVGSIRPYTNAYINAHSVEVEKLRPMFCVECGAFLNIGQRHTCFAPRCSECGEFLSAVDVKNGRSMCPACRAKYVAQIFSYHGWVENPIFQKTLKRSDVLHMGTEWETQYDGDYDDKKRDTAEVSATANPDPWKHNLRFMRDGTISGVEMITEPKTLRGYIESAELKNAVAKAKDLGFYTDYHTGAHIHLDRVFFGNKHEICGAMLCYMVGVYWDEFWKPLSRRETFNWCGKPSADKNDNIIDVYKKNSQMGDSNHNVAVNCGNYNTIELRFWSGTLDWDEIIARFDISRALAIWAKKTSSEALMSSKPSDIFKYIERKETFDYIRQYVTNSEILSAIPD